MSIFQLTHILHELQIIVCYTESRNFFFDWFSASIPFDVSFHLHEMCTEWCVRSCMPLFFSLAHSLTHYLYLSACISVCVCVCVCICVIVTVRVNDSETLMVEVRFALGLFFSSTFLLLMSRSFFHRFNRRCIARIHLKLQIHSQTYSFNHPYMLIEPHTHLDCKFIADYTH